MPLSVMGTDRHPALKRVSKTVTTDQAPWGEGYLLFGVKLCSIYGILDGSFFLLKYGRDDILTSSNI